MSRRVDFFEVVSRSRRPRDPYRSVDNRIKLDENHDRWISVDVGRARPSLFGTLNDALVGEAFTSMRFNRLLMHLNEKGPNLRIQPLCRETLFVFVLLGTGAAASLLTGAYSYKYEHPFNMSSPSMGWGAPSILSIYRNFTGDGGLWISSTFPLSLGHYCNAFIWGISFSPVVVLGVWLVARYGWWETWGGRLRAVIYVCAYLYGSILTAVTQRWANVIAPNGLPGANGPYTEYSLRFHFPGTQINAYYNDYSRPATDILLLLSVVLIFAPMAMILNAGNGLRHQQERFSIRTILRWTAFIAITLSYMRFLGQWYSPPTGYSSLSFSSAIGEFVFETIPATATALVAIFLLAKAPQGLLKYAILAVLALLVLDSLCDRLAISTVDYFGFFHRRQSPLAGPDRLMFQAGRIVGAWTALAIAAKMGLSFSASLKETEQSHALELAAAPVSPRKSSPPAK